MEESRPLPLTFSLNAFKLLLDVLVFNTFFLLLFEVSTLDFIDEFIEFPIVETLLPFLEDAELDFFSFEFY